MRATLPLLQTGENIWVYNINNCLLRWKQHGIMGRLKAQEAICSKYLCRAWILENGKFFALNAGQRNQE